MAESSDTVKVYKPGSKIPNLIPISRVANLVGAYQIAKENNLLPAGMDKDLLAMMVQEGRGDYGVDSGANVHYASPRNKRILETFFGAIPELNKAAPDAPVKKVMVRGEPHYDVSIPKTGYTPKPGAQSDAAVAMMAKLAIIGGTDKTALIKHYNGGGDPNYVDTVEIIKQELGKPNNAAIMNLYNMLSSPAEKDF
jgi:hypothetical protein